MTNDSHSNATLSSYGSYYNWCAATANTCNSYVNAGLTSIVDVCAKNWNLPNGYTGLFAAYNNNRTNFDKAFNTVYGGRYLSTTNVDSRGKYGEYWTKSTASTSSSTAATCFYPSSNGTTNLDISCGRYDGNNLRCIAK